MQAIDIVSDYTLSWNDTFFQNNKRFTFWSYVSTFRVCITRSCHDIEKISWLALCEGNQPVTGGFPSQRASYVELWDFACCQLEETVEQTMEWPEIWDAMVVIGHHCNVYWWYFPRIRHKFCTFYHITDYWWLHPVGYGVSQNQTTTRHNQAWTIYKIFRMDCMLIQVLDMWKVASIVYVWGRFSAVFQKLMNHIHKFTYRSLPNYGLTYESLWNTNALSWYLMYSVIPVFDISKQS